jgi:hypothetical protein
MQEGVVVDLLNEEIRHVGARAALSEVRTAAFGAAPLPT